jgi:hypothetical protein
LIKSETFSRARLPLPVPDPYAFRKGRSVRESKFAVKTIVVTAMIFGYLFFTAQRAANAQPPPRHPQELHISGLAPLDKDFAWAWGLKNNNFLLLNTNDQARKWKNCSLPSELAPFMDDQHKKINAPDEDFLYEIPLSISLPDRNNAWIAWLTKTDTGAPATVVTAHTSNRCESWTVVSASEPPTPAPTTLLEKRNPFSAAVHVQFIGDDGWALLFGNPEVGSCPSALMRTLDAGKSWQWLPAEEQRSYIPSQGCPPSRLKFADSTEGWLTQPDYFGDYSQSLWRTTDGGQSWTNLSSQIKTPEGLANGNSNTLEISPPGWSQVDSVNGTLGILYNKTTPQETADDAQQDTRQNAKQDVPDDKVQQTRAIYQTANRGNSWRLVKVFGGINDRESHLTFVDDRHGFVLIENNETNPAANDLAYTADGGLTWIRHKLPYGVSAAGLTMRDNILWATRIKNTNDPRPSILISSNGGLTWREKQFRIK